jgi:hypothetical protein
MSSTFIFPLEKGQIRCHIVASTMKIKESVTMFYYSGLAAPRDFYGKFLNLQTVFEDDWVTLFRITPNSLIGVIQGGENSFHQVQDTNAAMLSLVTDDVDAWHAKVIAYRKIEIRRDIANSKTTPVRGFIVADPGGYTVEFFQWL